jgi:predicted transposase YbfD/YdcC
MLPDPRPYFADLPDPRRETKNKLHLLSDIVMIVLCAVVSGIEDWVGMEEFAQEKEAWFRRFLSLPNGVPSHDTLSNVIGRIKPGAFAEAFTRWAQTALSCLTGEHVALDGKTLRGSREGESAVHLMSAFATQARLVLAQQTVADKSNEITAIPDLLDLLDVEGAIVTIDAIGCQKAIAKKITDKGADYVLALKDNHPQLADDVKLWLDTEMAKGRLVLQETVEKDHGRLEIRRYGLSTQLDWLAQKSEWSKLKAVGVVESIREIAGKSSTERRYYLCSIDDPERYAQVVRNHWRIENQQHWVLDVQFGEDANRARKNHSATNLALIRRTALNLLRHADDGKRSLRRRKMHAALNDDYRDKVLFGRSVT